MLLSTLRGVSCEARVQTLEGNRTWTLGPSAIHDLSAGPWLPIVNEALACSGSPQRCFRVSPAGMYGGLCGSLGCC